MTAAALEDHPLPSNHQNNDNQLMLESLQFLFDKRSTGLAEETKQKLKSELSACFSGADSSTDHQQHQHQTFLRLIKLCREMGADQICDDVRSLFLPFLSQPEHSDASFERGSETNDSQLQRQGSDDPQSSQPRNRGRPKRLPNSVASSSGNMSTMPSNISKSGEIMSAKCLVKTVAGPPIPIAGGSSNSVDALSGTSSTLHSSLPRDLSQSEFDLVDTITEMEVFPVSYGDLEKAMRSSETLRPRLSDISPAVGRSQSTINYPSAFNGNRFKPYYHVRKEDLKACSYLDFGSFSSFAPCYDSSDCSIGHHEYISHYSSALTVAKSPFYVEDGYYGYGSMVERSSLVQEDATITKEFSQQTMLEDIFPTNTIDQWKEHSKKSKRGSDNGDSTVENIVEFLEGSGIDLDELLEKQRAPPSNSAEINTILNNVNNELVLLASLQQDRLNSARIPSDSLQKLYSLTVPVTSQALNPLSELIEAPQAAKKVENPLVDNNTAIEQLLQPSAAEKVVYDGLVQDLIRCVPHVPISSLVKPSSIQKLVKSGMWEGDAEFVLRGTIITPPSASQTAPSSGQIGNEIPLTRAVNAEVNAITPQQARNMNWNSAAIKAASTMPIGRLSGSSNSSASAPSSLQQFKQFR